MQPWPLASVCGRKTAREGGTLVYPIARGSFFMPVEHHLSGLLLCCPASPSRSKVLVWMCCLKWRSGRPQNLNDVGRIIVGLHTRVELLQRVRHCWSIALRKYISASCASWSSGRARATKASPARVRASCRGLRVKNAHPRGKAHAGCHCGVAVFGQALRWAARKWFTPNYH